MAETEVKTPETKPKKKGMSLAGQIMIATVAGIIFGLIVGDWAGNIYWIGTLFLHLVQQCVVALIMTAVMVAMANPDNSGAGKIGFLTVQWIVIFTLISATVGIILGELVQPGAGIAFEAAENTTTVDQTLTDTILGFVSTNVFKDMANGNNVPCIVFSLFFGVAISQYTKSTGNRVMYDWVKGCNECIMNIVKMVMKVAPIGIFCLLAHVTGEIGLAVILPMFKFLACLFGGVIVELVVYCIFVSVRCKVNLFAMPDKFFKMSMIALTTTSSAITLPTKMEDMVTKFGVSNRISKFTGPITMAMNSSGGVTCYTLAIMFMAQSSGIELSLPQLCMAILFSCMMCMGTIVVPGGVVITYTFLAQSMGFAPESFIVLVGIDWFSGMARTLNNVDVDVLLAMLVSNKMGELDHDIYDGKKVGVYE